MASQFAKLVLENRHKHDSVFPVKHKVYQFVFDLIELLYPQFIGEFVYFKPDEIDGQLALLKRDLKKILQPMEPQISKPLDAVCDNFFAELPNIYEKLWLDAQAISEGDPASESIDEVISAYPGFFAIYTYRIAHKFYKEGIPVFPRILTEYAHYKSGIDIHPGAEIGRSFFMDHGTGVVIGETTNIGNNVKIYQGVTLGALSVSGKLTDKKRHPNIEDNVIVYSNATILGGKTTIGHDSIIGGNVWLTESVAPYSVVYNKSEVKIRPKNLNNGAIFYDI